MFAPQRPFWQSRLCARKPRLENFHEVRRPRRISRRTNDRIQAVLLHDRVDAFLARQAHIFRQRIRVRLERPVRGRPPARRLRPRTTDYVVLKTKHSAFYATTLPLLLRCLEANTLVPAGLTGDRCVPFAVPSDDHSSDPCAGSYALK